MDKIKSGLIFLFIPLMFAFFACASARNKPPPAWVLNVQSVYPWDDYITGRGDGRTRQDAELKSQTEIHLYFDRETTVERSRRAAWVEGNISPESRTEENIITESHTRLVGVAVRFAEDPWFNSALKAWETVAYIVRDEAWIVYEPTAKRQADAFLALARAADEETEPLNRVLRYGTAINYALSAEFNAIRNFAQALHPTSAGDLFAETDVVIAGLLDRQRHARERVAISIECPVDHDRLIYQAMVKVLGAAGFAATSGGSANTFCVIRVEEGMQRQDSGTMYYPSLTVTISGRTGAMISFRVAAERAGAINPDVAKRRAYESLASALESVDFDRELQQWQSALIRN